MNMLMKEDLLFSGYVALDVPEAVKRIAHWCDVIKDEQLKHQLVTTLNLLENHADEMVGREIYFSSKNRKHPVYVPVTQRYCRYEAEVHSYDTISINQSFCDDDCYTYWAPSEYVCRKGFIVEINNLDEIYDTYKGYVIL